MKFKSVLIICALSTVIISCRRENESSDPDVLKEWFVPIRSEFANPASTTRTDSGMLHIQLLETNTIRYDYTINGYDSDEITSATLNAGDPVTNGPVILDLRRRGLYNYATGVVFNVRQTLVDSLLANTSDIYFTANTAARPNGVVRGQLNSTITLAANVNLTGNQQVPPVNTTATGTAIVRVTSDRNVYTLVTVNNVEPADRLTTATIHTGAAGATGNALVTVASSASDFGVPKITSVDEITYNTLLNSPLYLNVASVLAPNGKVRGQIK